MDLWPDISTDTIEDNCVLDILREQARIIKEKTGGVIQSTVSIIEYSTYNKMVGSKPRFPKKSCALYAGN